MSKEGAVRSRHPQNRGWPNADKRGANIWRTSHVEPPQSKREAAAHRSRGKSAQVSEQKEGMAAAAGMAGELHIVTPSLFLQLQIAAASNGRKLRKSHSAQAHTQQIKRARGAQCRF